MRPLFRTKKFISHFGNRRGVSLIIAIIFTTFMMLISIDLAKNIRITIENIRRSHTGTQAYYLAKSAEELIAFSVKHPEKFKGRDPKAWIEGKIESMARNTLCIRMNGEPKDPCDLHLKTSYEIHGRPTDTLNTPPLGNFYSIPSPEFHTENGETFIFGTGNAGYPLGASNEVCRKKDDKSQKGGNNSSSEPGLKNGDHSCHWNKLTFGEFVEIPLYYEDENGNLVNPSEPDRKGNTFESLILRVRTPCKGYEGGQMNCSTIDRIELYPPTSVDDPIAPRLDIEKDKTMVHWQIIGEDSNKKETVTLWARQKNEKQKRNPLLTTEIYASKINNNKSFNNFVLLNEKTGGEDVKDRRDILIKFLKNESPWNNQDLHKPVLRLELISIPRDYWNLVSTTVNTECRGVRYTECKRIPYLEYQILTNRPISDFKTWIRGYVEVNGIKRSFETVLEKPKTLGRGFVLDQF